MAQAEAEKGQGQPTRLSADAEAFVPSQFKGPGGGGFVNGGLNAQQYSVGELPHYITSCYPFVTDQGGASQRGPVQWCGPGRPSLPSSTAYRMPRPQPGMHSHRGQFRAVGPGGRHMRPMGMTPVMPPGLGPPSSLIGTLPAHAQTYSGLNSPQGYGYPYPVQQINPANPWQHNHFAMDYNSFGNSGRVYTTSSHALTSQVETSDTWSGSERSKSSDRGRSKKKKDNMVSVGIQNEVGTINSSSQLPNHPHNLISPGRKRTRTRTIILMDAANQTDFADEIANQTLADRPNALFKRGRVRARRAGDIPDYTSTDSEEESDSGYSSPLHRRNQTSNGTHPAVSMETVSEPQVHSQIGMMSYSNVVMAPAAGVITYPNNGYTSPYVHGYQTIPGSIQPDTNNMNSYSGIQGPVKTEPEDNVESGTGKKKRRRNKRKKKKMGGDDVGGLSDEPLALYHAHSSSNVSRTSGEPSGLDVDTGVLHFEDENEFPELHSAPSGYSLVSQPTAALSYSQIVQSTSQPSSGLSQGLSQELSLPKGDTVSMTSAQSALTSTGSKESKTAKKRRKRREMANRAAEEELAEISLEQQVLMEHVKLQQKQRQPPPPPPPVEHKPGKKSNAPISLNLGAMLDAFEQKQQEEQMQPASDETSSQRRSLSGGSVVGNLLDASAPSKRGKERETPKPKKPSPLKKVILKEREEKKRIRLLEESSIMSPSTNSATNPEEPTAIIPMAGMGIDSDLSQDGSKTSREEAAPGNPASEELSPISQESPISMSPLTPGGSPLSSGINSPVAANNVLRETRTCSLAMKIHSRRFREYCNQILDKEIDNCCTMLLQDLVRFQDRLYHKDPVKAKSKRRIVLGLREVTKHLKLRKIKCVVISPNLERIQSKGGLDEALNAIISMCHEQSVPFVFALGRRALGRACAKLVPVSVVGIFNFEGSEVHFQELMNLMEQAREAYREMVQILQKDMADNPLQRSAHMQLFAHMGHSRTPSACSAISFTSSILSEPISENYPHSEPETDSRGYEIKRHIIELPKSNSNSTAVGSVSTGMTAAASPAKPADNDERSDSPNSSSCSQGGKNIIVESLHEIDEGHEADTEDLVESNGHKKEPKREETSDVTKTDRERKPSPDPQGELPHIDSIHASPVDLHAEILSQHSAKTQDLNMDGLSGLSYKTTDGSTVKSAESSAAVSEKSRGKNNPDNEEYTGQKLRPIDKERIESWVVEAQHCISGLKIYDSGSGESNQTISKTCTAPSTHKPTASSQASSCSGQDSYSIPSLNIT